MKFKNGLLVISFFFFGAASAQEKEQVPPPPGAEQCIEQELEIVDFPDLDAEFPGGEQALRGFIRKNLIYPEKSRKNKDVGRVYVSFFVEEDGSITTIEVISGGLTPELNAEAIRLVQMMPNWLPAEEKGRLIRSRQRLPITFELF